MSIDQQSLFDHVDGDQELLEELIEIFVDYYPGQLQILKAAIENGDCVAIRETAHQFKGALSNFYVKDAARLAKDIEEAGKNQQVAEAKSAFEQLHSEVEKLNVELNAPNDICNHKHKRMAEARYRTQIRVPV